MIYVIPSYPYSPVLLHWHWNDSTFAPVPLKYRQSSNIRHTHVGNKLVDHSDVVETSPFGAAPTTSSFVDLKTWLHWIGQRQLQDETRVIQILWFGASYNRDFIVILNDTDKSSTAQPQQNVTKRETSHISWGAFYKCIYTAMGDGYFLFGTWITK